MSDADCTPGREPRSVAASYDRMLIAFCSNNGKKIGNTFFKHKDIHKKSWLSPDGLTRIEIGYICVNKKWATSLVAGGRQCMTRC